MTNLNYRVVGSTRVANNLRAKAAAADNTSPITKKWALGVRSKLKGKKYPPRLPHFKHRRTGDLANKWAVIAAGKNAWTIENRANRRGFPYPVVVVGNSKGERRGRGTHPSFARWWIARKVIDGEIPKLKDAITKHILEAS